MVGDGMWGRDGRGVRSAKYQEVECCIYEGEVKSDKYLKVLFLTLRFGLCHFMLSCAVSYSLADLAKRESTRGFLTTSYCLTQQKNNFQKSNTSSEQRKKVTSSYLRIH